MKNYEIDLIWFAPPIDMTFERAKLFTDVVRKHRTDCLINSRLILRARDKVLREKLELFDYISVGDKEVPPPKLPLDFESPDSVNTVCAGGNHLLNNGPMGNGRLDPEAVRLYGVIGDWLRKNGESIYNTRRNPLPERPEWGNRSVSRDGKSLYLHILDGPESNVINLDALASEVTAAEFLATGGIADFTRNGQTITLRQIPLRNSGGSPPCA